MADLFALEDLPSVLQVASVDTESATRARRIASGWLSRATGYTSWPSPVPDDLWAWGLELAAIAYNNPTLASFEQVDDYSIRYEDRLRRREILDSARSAYNTNAGPVYSFPEPDWHWTSVATVLPD